MIPEQTIAEIKARVDIGDVIGRYVSLKKRGKNLVGLCPFHNEKTPSFNVRPDEGYFRCFGCDAKGDVVTFLERHTGQRFIDVIKGLAGEAGIEIEERQLSPEEQARQERRRQVLKALEVAGLFFKARFRDPDEGKAARTYLLEERQAEPAVVAAFSVGFGGRADDGLVKYLQQHGVDPAVAEQAGLVRQGERGPYDFYRRRLLFPVRNRRGEVIAFGGRAFLERDRRGPKYVNGPETAVYKKSQELFGLFEALPALKRGKPAVLVEGYFDVLATHTAGLGTGVAPCGTAVTDQHVDLLSRYTDEVVLCFDRDQAGRKARERATLLFLQRGFVVRWAELLAKDPDEAIQEHGPGALLASLEAAPHALDVVIRESVERATGSVAARVTALTEALPFLAAVSDEELWQSQYIRRAAQALSESEDTLRDQVRTRGEKLLRERLSSSRAPASSRGPGGAGPAAGPVAVDLKLPAGPERGHAKASRAFTAAERSLLRALVCHPDLAPRASALVPHMKNTQLAQFIEQLRNGLIEHGDKTPREVLASLHAEVSLAREIAGIFQRRGLNNPDAHISAPDARALIEDFVRQVERRALEDKLGQVSRAIETASSRGDTPRELLAEQRGVARRLAQERAVDKPAPALATTPTPRQLPAGPATPAPAPEVVLDDDDGFDDPAETHLEPGPAASEDEDFLW